MTAEHVFVTGGAGFVGAPLVRALLQSGRTVTVFDRFHFGAKVLADVANNPRLRLIEGDVRRFDSRHLDGVDAVVHLAALSNDPAGDLRPGWAEAVNTVATRRVAEAAKGRGISKFVFASSCAIYGGHDSEMVDEDSEVAPLSAYARSKLEAEHELVKLTGDGFAPIRLRSATVFGVSSRMRFDLVVNLMTLKAVTEGLIRVMGGGLQWRPLIHVHDLVSAYMACLGPEGEALKGGAFNIVGSNIQMRELGLTIQRCVGHANLKVVPDVADPRSYRVSGERFARTAHFAPAWSLEQGIAEVRDAVRSGVFGDGTDPLYHTVLRLKEVIETPAVAGGMPARSEFLPFARPSLGREEEEEVLDSLRSGWITTGPKVQRLEGKFAEYLGAKHAIAVSSCTAALHVSLAALSIGPGDEVITSPVTWPTTASVAIHLGAKPVFVDVERDTLNLDPSLLESAITPRTRAIVPVHIAGQACDLDAINAIAERHGIAVVEDAAHAIGGIYRGRKIGTISPLTCFSFYPTKNMTTIEGGLVTTANDELAEKIRVLSFSGISRDAWKRYSSAGSLHWQLLYPGFKYNMTDIQAAVGLHQIEKLDGFIDQREAHVRRYREMLADAPGVSWLADRSWGRHARHMFEILVEPDALTIDRDGFLTALKAENIGTGVHFVSLHLQPYYQTMGYKPANLPIANWISQRIISLPLFPAMTADDVEDVAGAVRRIAIYYRRPKAAHTTEANAKYIAPMTATPPIAPASGTPCPINS
jgi:dTDP-4-amino-4,6-dideoxygalactose transaminase/nucleoside-diphosphate-sugar epimerase